MHFALVRDDTALLPPHYFLYCWYALGCVLAPKDAASQPLQLNTVVLTAREGFRRACLRGGADEEDARKALSVAWLVVSASSTPQSWPHGSLSQRRDACPYRGPRYAPQVPIGALCSAICAYGVLASTSGSFTPSVKGLSDYDQGILLYSVAGAPAPSICSITHTIHPRSSQCAANRPPLRRQAA